MKQCFKCKEIKKLSYFYKHSMMADGHLNKCKECAKKDVNKNRYKNIDYYKQYDISRASLPHRIEARKRYAKTANGIASTRRAHKKWITNNPCEVINIQKRYINKYPEKYIAHTTANNAIKSGKLKRMPCEKCNKIKVEAHHDDYSKPLDVRWLCKRCHDHHHVVKRHK